MNKPDEQNQEEVEQPNKPQKKVELANPTEDVNPTEEVIFDEVEEPVVPVAPTGKKKRRNTDDAEDSSEEKDSPEMMEKVIAINRITKVTKGGKNLSFSALVVVGDAKGRVGYCLDKANEVATAIKKAVTGAKKNMIDVPLKGTTITHEIIGRCGGATVLLKPAVDGTGVIASGPVRAVCDGAGIHNILTKCHRSNNPINVVKATIDGLSRLKTKK